MSECLVCKNKNNPFLEIYDAFTEYSPLSITEYSINIIPFIFKDKVSVSNRYTTAKRYLYRPWKEDGERDEAAYQKCRKIIQKKANKLIEDELTLIAKYADNPLVAALSANKSIYEKIRNIIKKVSSDRKSYDNITEADPIKFLFISVCAIYNVYPENTAPKESIIGEMTALLGSHGVKMEHLYDYTKKHLFTYAQSGTYGLLELMNRTGSPDSINENCDPFSLLEMADNYQSHRFTGGVAVENNRDFEYSYKYSEVVYKKYRLASAAWNLGFYWYKCSDLNIKPESSFKVEQFWDNDSSFNPTKENYYRQALKYFAFSAERGHADGYTSIGNICYKMLKGEEPYPELLETLIKTTIMCGICEEHEYLNLKTYHEKCKLAMQMSYKQGAEKGSIPGMANYYKCLFKEIMQDNTTKTLTELKDKHKDAIVDIKRYIEKLCCYGVPEALTDKACLKLHLHDINYWLEENGKTSGKINTPNHSDYNFIFTYYKKTPDGESQALHLLKRATDCMIPELRSHKPWYKLSVYHLYNKSILDALKYIRKALESEPADEKEIKLLETQYKKCMEAFNNNKDWVLNKAEEKGARDKIKELVRKKLLTHSQGAEELNVSEEEFEKILSES